MDLDNEDKNDETKDFNDEGTDDIGVEDTQEYFPTAKGKGYFARLTSIAHLNLPAEFYQDARRLDEQEGTPPIGIDDAINPNGVSLISCKYDDRVHTAGNYTGIVKFIGFTHFDNSQLIGLELDAWNPNGHDGTIHGQDYYRCQPGRGMFVRPEGIVENLGSSNVDDQVNIDDYVLLCTGKCGIIRFKGQTKKCQSILLGIELDCATSSSSNGHDGSIEGIKYFQCKDKHGIFVKPCDVIKIFLPTPA